MEDVEGYLAVGLIMFLDLSIGHGKTSRCKVIVRGWLREHWIWLDLPRGQEPVRALAQNRTYGLRFVREGAACGFTTHVIETFDLDDADRCSGVRVSWPERIETVNVREAPRATTHVSCVAVTAAGASVTTVIHNLSAGGCAVAWKEGNPPSDGETLALSFTAPGGLTADGIPVIVRSRKPDGSGWLLGCAFGQMDETLRNTIRLYVVDVVAGQRGGQPDQVVILTRQPTQITPLVAELRKRRCEVAVTEHVMNAAYWLGAAPPQAFVISHDLNGISAPDLCRMVRGTPSMNKLPVYVYGSGDDAFGAKVMEAGATGYYASAQAAVAIAELIETPDNHQEDGQ